jgi:hypothetical protein
LKSQPLADIPARNQFGRSLPPQYDDSLTESFGFSCLALNVWVAIIPEDQYLGGVSVVLNLVDPSPDLSDCRHQRSPGFR